MSTAAAAAAAAAGTDEATARKRWELENNIQQVELDEIFKFDEKAVSTLLDAHPWRDDPHYFKSVKISAVALLKMVMHACTGGTLEVMGLMLGKVVGNSFVVLDSFSLPVTGTETRVNAGQEAESYMVEYVGAVGRLGRKDTVCGWYHSHPGYGCWLSGIDVATESLYQQYQDPFLAIVVDPTRTIAAGRVEIGAFRTYPPDYVPPLEAGRKYQSVPLAKIEDFGSHANKYYPVEVSYFKSSLDAKLLDLLWHKYWINTLSSSPLVANKDYNDSQVKDLAEKLAQVDPEYLADKKNAQAADGKSESALSRVTADSAKVAREQMHSLISMVMKEHLFNGSAASETTAIQTIELAREIEKQQV